MWTDEARQASADARKGGEKAKDQQVVQNIRGWLGIKPGGPKGGPGTQAMRDAAAAATLAQGHPKSSTPGYVIQSRGAKIMGERQGSTPWRAEKVVGASQSLTNPAAKAERIAMRMATDSKHRAAPSQRQAFRVK